MVVAMPVVRSGTAPAFVTIRDVSKTFDVDGDVVDAVERIDLDIAPGEFVTLLGPSGCGKSTLLMMVAGLETPSRGTIAIGGTPIPAPPPDIRILFHQPTPLPCKSPLHTLPFPF